MDLYCDAMKSILLINWYANRSGGADSYTHDLALRLAGRGHRVSVACIAATPELADCVQLLPLRRPESVRYPLIWRFEALVQRASVAYQMAWLPAVRPDIVLNSLPFAAGPLRERFPSASHIYFPHALISPVEVAGYQSGLAARLAFALYSQAERRAILRSATTVRFTDHNCTVLQQFYRLPKSSRFAIVPSAVAVPEIHQLTPSRNVVRLLFVGRLVASKNVGFLIESLAELTALPWILNVVGDGPERAALERLAFERGLAGRVLFHGHQPDPSEFYASADLFAFPSLLENLGLVMLEAMAHGVPVLGFLNDGVRFRNSSHELIQNDVDGILVPDDTAFRAALARWISDPAPLAALGANARVRVLERHSWPVVLDRWEALFDRLHGQPRQ